MKHYLAGKDYLGLLYYTPEQMNELIEIAQDLKRKWVMGEPHAYLRDKAYAMVFEKKSTRTRNSFHAAATALGAQSFYLRPDELQTSRGESIADTGRILDRYFDGLYIRTFGQEIVEEFAQNMKHPVINALTALEHPCQALCDLLTIKEKKGDFKGVKICYAGDVYNVCNSLLLGATMFGMDMSIAAPKRVSLCIASLTCRNVLTRPKTSAASWPLIHHQHQRIHHLARNSLRLQLLCTLVSRCRMYQQFHTL